LEKAHEELKKTYTQLVHPKKLAPVGQLAAGVAHEINNPMGSISSNLNTLKKVSGKTCYVYKCQVPGRDYERPTFKRGDYCSAQEAES